MPGKRLLNGQRIMVRGVVKQDGIRLYYGNTLKKDQVQNIRIGDNHDIGVALQ